MSTSRPAVSEAALEFLLIELVRTYHARGEEGRRTMEAMGFQVGTQLAERCVSISCAGAGAPPATSRPSPS